MVCAYDLSLKFVADFESVFFFLGMTSINATTKHTSFHTRNLLLSNVAILTTNHTAFRTFVSSSTEMQWLLVDFDKLI